MNKLQKRRLYMVGFMAMGLSIAISLILFALKQNINVFLTPKQLAETAIQPNYHFRLGGLVKQGSVVRDKEGLGVSFIVTDLKQELPVHYVGILPDLFREGTGVIAEGSLDAKHIFNANLILAKHDENYMPKNVYKVLRETS